MPRLRHLSPGQEARLAALRRVSHWLDSALPVPGTSFRVGLDPLLGLIPGIGDFVSPMFAMAILWQSRDLGLPHVVRLRMVFNVAIDALVGAIPVLGDAFDFAWRANDKNLALLEQYAREERAPSAGDWLFVIGAMAILAGLIALPFVLVAWLVALLGHALRWR